MGTSKDELMDIIWKYEELIYRLADAPHLLSPEDIEEIDNIRQKMR